MEIRYVPDINLWENWQRDYRFGVILIFPPDPPLKEINTLRSKYDPESQAICQTHISLTVPLPRSVDDASMRELRDIASGIKSFTIHYGPLSHYLPNPGVVLAIEPQVKLNRLRINLENASVFRGAPPRKYPFSAHMTISEFITVERTKDLIGELRDSAPKGHFQCSNVTYAVPDVNFHFIERAKLELTG